MAYVKPATVLSPRDSIEELQVLYDAGAGRWAAASMKWDGVDRLGLRWNGSDGQLGVGSPQSRGHPTWFIVPEELDGAVRLEVERLRKQDRNRLSAGYRAMARDRIRESEATEWTEELIEDGTDSEG